MTASSKFNDLELMFRQLSLASRGGVPSGEMVILLADASERSSRLLRAIGDRLSRGAPLSSALADHPRTFAPETVDLVRRAEQGPALAATLEALADDYARRAVVGRAYGTALFYPASVWFVVLFVAAVMLVYVMPPIAEAYDDLGAELPAPAAGLWALWNSGDGLLLPALVVLALVALIAIARGAIPGLRLPLVGSFEASVFETRAAALLSGIVAAEPQLLPAAWLHLAATAPRGDRNRLREIGFRASSVQQLAAALRDAPRMSRRIVALMELAAKTRDAAGLRERMAGWHAAELDRRVDSFESRALTLFYVTAGFTIMWLLLAVYVPIFRLGGVV